MFLMFSTAQIPIFKLRKATHIYSHMKNALNRSISFLKNHSIADLSTILYLELYIFIDISF